MRIILTITFTFYLTFVFSQTIEERELNLKTHTKGTTWGTKTDKALELLTIDKFNSVAIEYILGKYNTTSSRDSMGFFLDNLIKANKESALPYLLRVRFAEYEALNENKKIEYLSKAYQIDSSNIEIDSILGRLCYDKFSRHFAINHGNDGKIGFYAKTSLNCFNRLCDIDNHFQETLKYPLIQISYFLNDSIRIKKYRKFKEKSFYFPITTFGRVPKNWEKIYSFNFFEEHSFFVLEWYSKNLRAMAEPVLFKSTDSRIYRFTWLRTFHNPIVIALKNDKNKIKVYWKVCNGMGGYEPGILITDKYKELSQTEWTKFIDNINTSNFWNMTSEENQISGLDGAEWILEGNELGKYHVVDRWGGQEIRKICLDLLKLTDLEIEGKVIY